MKLFTALWCCVGFAAALKQYNTNNCAKFDETKYDPVNVITRDVCIVGGGVTGTYAAISLRDIEKSVVVIEHAKVLGGAVNTYTVPGTNTTVDYGIQAFEDSAVVRNFFNRFEIPLTSLTFPTPETKYVDFQTGEVLTNFTAPVPNIAAYSAQLAKYPYLAWTFELPNPVPQDLLLPFREFVTKYGLEDIVYSVLFITEGIGNLLDQLTIYVLKYFDAQYIKGDYLVTANHNNHKIFDKALTELGTDALVSSHVLAAQRSLNSTGVKLVVQTPTGNKLIKASKLLITIIPELYNMAPFDLDESEESLFEQFNNSAWYLGLVSNTGLPNGVTYQNTHPDTSYNLPPLPGLYSLVPSPVANIFRVEYGSQYGLPNAQVKAEMLAAIARVRDATTSATSASLPELVEFANHTPFQLTVSPQSISDGFYTKLYALQGHRDTWYTGRTFLGPHFGPLLNFTHTLLPRIIAA